MRSFELLRTAVTSVSPVILSDELRGVEGPLFLRSCSVEAPGFSPV